MKNVAGSVDLLQMLVNFLRRITGHLNRCIMHRDAKDVWGLVNVLKPKHQLANQAFVASSYF